MILAVLLWAPAAVVQLAHGESGTGAHGTRAPDRSGKKETRRGAMQLVSVLISLVPFIIASVAMPTWILLVVVLLTQAKRRVEAIAFVSGVTLIRLAQGVLFGLILSTYDVPSVSGGPELEIVVSVLLVSGGILLWAAALQQWLVARSSSAAVAPSPEQLELLEGADNVPGGREPRWRAVVRRITPVKALLLGAVLVTSSPRAWLFTLGAMGVIAQAYLRPSISLAAYLFYVVGANLLIVAPILVSSSTWFDAAAEWLELHNRTLVIVASLVVGSIFLWRGGIGLVSGLVVLAGR